MSSISNSNYPNGFLNGITIRGEPLLSTHPGNLFWVNNSGVNVVDGVGASDGNDGSFNRPFSTLAGALAKTAVVASRGDIIALMPGHAETISTATALGLSKAGVAIVGIGSGTLRPTFTLGTATTATIAVSAANISIKNVVFTASFADIADLFTLTTAVQFHLEDCEFNAADADENFVEIVDTFTTDNTADGLSFLRCKWIEPDLATTSLVNVDADLDQLSVIDCYFNLGVNTNDLPVVAIVATGKDVTNLFIHNNSCIRLNDANPLLVTMDTTTANTGIISNNYVRHLDVGTELLVTVASNIGFFENFATAAVDKSGFILPAIDT